MKIENSFAIDEKMLDGRTDVRKDDLAVDPKLANAMGRIKNAAISSVTLEVEHGMSKTIKRQNGPKVYANDLGLNDDSLEGEAARDERLSERKDVVCNLMADIISQRIIASMNGDETHGFLFDYLKSGETYTDMDRETLNAQGVALRYTKNETLIDWIESDLGEYLRQRLEETGMEPNGEYPFANSSLKVTVVRAYPFSLSLKIEKLNQ